MNTFDYLLDSDNPALERALSQLQYIADTLEEIPLPESALDFDVFVQTNEYTGRFLTKIKRHLEDAGSQMDLVANNHTTLSISSDGMHKEIFLHSIKRAGSLIASLGYFVLYRYSFGSASITIWRKKPDLLYRFLFWRDGYVQVKAA